jgi:hypothetical protein
MPYHIISYHREDIDTFRLVLINSFLIIVNFVDWIRYVSQRRVEKEDPTGAAINTYGPPTQCVQLHRNQ